MGESQYQRFVARFALGIDELTEARMDIFPQLPPTPPVDGQPCRICGQPAVSVQIKPLEFTSQEDILTDQMQFRVVQKYRYVCRDHELET